MQYEVVTHHIQKEPQLHGVYLKPDLVCTSIYDRHQHYQLLGMLLMETPAAALARKAFPGK